MHCNLQLRCAKGATSCYIYRLSSPCLNGFSGRCITTPDRTLSQGLFSVAPPLGLT